MSKGSNKTTTTSNTTADQSQQQSQAYTPNPYIAAAGQQALTGAQNAANAPFQMPVAPTAQFSPFQQQAFNQIQGMQGMSMPYFQQGAGMLQGSAAPITGQDVSQYYNPFAQNVTNQMQNIFGQQNRMATSNAVRSAGGVGADRIGVAQANLANQQGLAAGQTYAGMYNQALQAAQQQRQMMAGAGFGMGQLGGAMQTSYLQGTGALAQAGAQQQALDQARQNAVYQNRLAEIAYPFQTNQYLAGITGGLAPAMGGTTEGQSTSHGTSSGQSVTEKPQPSALNQILGIGGSLLGAVVGGPAGAMIGGSLGSSLGGAFGGGGSELVTDAPGGGLTPGNFTFSNRGGRIGRFASGGVAYGRLAEQQFANSPVGNPYASHASDDSDSEDNDYADGGPLPQGPQPQMRAPPPPQGMMPPGMPQGMPPQMQQRMPPAPGMLRGLPPGMLQRMPQGMPQGMPPPQQMASQRMAPQVTPQMMQQMQLLQQRRPMPMPQGPPPVPQQIPQQPMGLPQRSPFGMAEGGAVEEEEPTPMPGTRAPSTTATSVVPKIPLRMGTGHSNLISGVPTPLSFTPLDLKLDLRHAPDEKQSSSGSEGLNKLASVAGKALSIGMSAARGGPVNPYDAYQGFQEGGDVWTDEGESWAPEPMQGIDAPMGRTEPHFSMGDVASRAGDYYGGKAAEVGQAMAGPEPDPQSPWNVQKHVQSAKDVFGVGPPSAEAARPPPESPFSEPQAGPPSPIRQAREGDEVFSPDAVPRPLGDPRTKRGAKYAMVGELEKGEATPNTIAGISMNVKDESKFNPFDRHWDQHDPRFRGTEAENAHGLFQEGGDEWNNYVAWLKKNYPDAPWQDPRLQTRFLVERLKTGYPETWAKMQNAKTSGEAAAIFTSEYLRPAKQHEVRRVNKYLSGRGDDSADGETNVSAKNRETNPYIVGNKDMTLANLRMPERDRPYPGARERNWGTDLARSPWSALVVGGARMAQTVGPVGSALGAGIEAGMGHLEGQRKSLQTEEGINQRAEALYQHAKDHLDKYQRMTPGEQAMSEWRQARTESGTALQKNAKWLMDNGIAPDIHTAYDMAHSGVNQPAVYGRMIEAAKANIIKLAAQSGQIISNEEAEQQAKKVVDERFKGAPGARAKPTPTTTDLDYVKAHPETRAKFKEKFGIDPPTG